MRETAQRTSQPYGGGNSTVTLAADSFRSDRVNFIFHFEFLYLGNQFRYQLGTKHVFKRTLSSISQK